MAMDEGSFGYSLVYSVTTVLCGYLFPMPFWLVGLGWNRVRPRQSINPWLLPFASMVFLLVCFVISTKGFRGASMQDNLVALGLLPGAIGYGLAAYRFRKRAHDVPAVDDL